MSLVLLGILNSQAAAAAGGGAAYDLLETTTLASNANSVTFTGLGSYSDYKHLQLRMVGGIYHSYSGTYYKDYYLTLNGDTGSNYAWSRLGRFSSMSSFSSTLESTAVGSQSNVTMNLLPTQNEDYDYFAGSVIDILDFSSTNKNTTIRALGGYAASLWGGIYMRGGAWFNTNAVTSITLTPTAEPPNTVQFRAESRFSLYGVK